MLYTVAFVVNDLGTQYHLEWTWASGSVKCLYVSTRYRRLKFTALSTHYAIEKRSGTVEVDAIICNEAHRVSRARSRTAFVASAADGLVHRWPEYVANNMRASKH